MAHFSNRTTRLSRATIVFVLSRLLLIVCLAVFALGCGGGNTTGSPVAPTPTPAPTPAPAPTPPPPTPAPAPRLAQINGAWNGTHELQRLGTKLFGTIAMTFDQNERTIKGTWLFTSGAGTGGPGFNDWHGEITGTLTLDSNGTTRFSGTATIIAEVVGQNGACHGASAMEGVMSDTSIRLEGPNVVYRDCTSTTGGLVWMLTRDGGNPPPPTPPPPTPPPPGQPSSLTCTASTGVGAESNATTITFDEPEVEAIQTFTESTGSYASCPYRYTDTLSQFSVKGVSLQGRYTLRGRWNGCTSSNPAVWDGGVLQTRDSVLTLGINATPRPTAMRFSLGVDGSNPSPLFNLTVTDSAGATANATVTTLLGRVALSCSNPIASVRISHDGPSWIMDSLAF